MLRIKKNVHISKFVVRKREGRLNAKGITLPITVKVACYRRNTERDENTAVPVI